MAMAKIAILCMLYFIMHTVVWKSVAPFLIFLHVCHTLMFQIIKLI